MSKHKHHIIPVYHCKELGIDPDFDENYVMVDRLDHARIHWGYKCDDLEPLFEYITPAQWIIDLIPRGDNRDVGAAVLTAKGELDEVDMSGENHYFYGRKHTEDTKKKMSAAKKGTTLSEEHKKKLSEANKGKTLSEEHKKKISEAKKGKNNSMSRENRIKRAAENQANSTTLVEFLA